MTTIRYTFLVTSVINYSDKRIYHSPVRSVFTPAQRIDQTRQTIESIRKNVPGAWVILIEMGALDTASQSLREITDEYVFVGDQPAVRRAVDSRNRGLGEAKGLLVASTSFARRTDFYFKMSGRYILTEKFDLSLWSEDGLMARMYENGISTRLYGFKEKYFPIWQRALKRSLLPLYFGRSLEDVFPKKFGSDNIKVVQTLGLSGYVAPDGSYLEE